jgi:outer membrane protein assembly factor BamA
LVIHQNNNGYPFALAAFDSLRFVKEKLHISLAIDKGRLIYFDTIAMEGRLDMRSSFFHRLLDVKKGSAYSHSKVERSSLLIRDLQYVEQRSQPYIRFINDRAVLVLTLDPKPASRFDFLIGVLPQVVGGVRKWNLIVDINAEFNNSFRRGEYTFVQFKRLKPENLELQLKSTIPYIGGLPVGTHVDFRMFKNGLQNLDLYFDGGTQYLFGGFNQLRLFGSFRSSRLLEIDKIALINAGKLPSRLDLNYSGVGMSLNLRQLDYRFNPTKGYNAEITAVVGRKTIVPNRQIIDIPEYANSYDSLKLSTLQGELNANAAYYFKIKNWATVKTEVNAGWRYNEQRILTNELMRIGGNRLLRGFDEESVFTDFYAFSTAEFRIIFDQNSYLSLPFIDYGYVNINTDEVRQIQPVLGVGMGLNFGTAAGVFNISFAAGKQGNNSLDFSRMKIHFGYVSLF